VAAAALTGGAPIAPPAELEMPSSFGRTSSRPASFAPPARMHPLVRELLWGGVLVLAIAAAGMSAWLLLR
jgi:hypothetical protein